MIGTALEQDFALLCTGPRWVISVPPLEAPNSMLMLLEYHVACYCFNFYNPMQLLLLLLFIINALTLMYKV